MLKDKKFDLIVVGTGFASSFFLKKYLEKSPLRAKVLVLERGILYPHYQRLKSKRGNGEQAFQNAENFRHTYINENPEKHWVFDPNFGGSSNCWTGCVPRFMPNDFQMKSAYGVGADWPITYDELESYYTEAEEIMAISGPDETPFPKSKKYPLPPHVLSTVDEVLHKRHGSLYISQPSARATSSTGTRGICCSSAVCRLCPVDSKFTIENTLQSIYKDPRVELIYEAQVAGLELQDNIAKSVTYYKNNKEHTVSGEVIVLGANAIFNPHILLNSGDKNANTGIGLTEQRGIFADLLLENFNNVGGHSIITANGFMMYDGQHRKKHAGCLIENINVPFIRNENGKWRQIARFKFIYEDLPSELNKVEKSGDLLIPKVNYSSHTDYVDKAFNELRGNIEKYFSCLPLEDIIINEEFEKTEFHICSTTRMSNDAKTGVIDRNLIHHQYRNVIVLGSSAFPTITPANPTLTLSALSLMSADNVF